MLDPKFFDNLAKQLAGLIPPGLSQAGEDLHKNIRQNLVHVFSRLNLVTREEFDIQVRLLESAKERIRILEDKIAQLEEASQ